MALLTASELKQSREAKEAGVDSASNADCDLAIAEAEAALYLHLGWRLEVSETTLTVRAAGSDIVYLPQRARTATALTVAGTPVALTDWHLGSSGWTLHRHSDLWVIPDDEADLVITGTFGYGASDPEWILAKRIVRTLAVRHLRTSPHNDKNLPSVPGAYLTSYTSESASFNFFTPTGDITGDAEIDRLLLQLKAARPEQDDTLRSIQLQSNYARQVGSYASNRD